MVAEEDFLPSYGGAEAATADRVIEKRASNVSSSASENYKTRSRTLSTESRSSDIESPQQVVDDISNLGIVFPRVAPSRMASITSHSTVSRKAEEKTRNLIFSSEVSRLEQGRFFWSSNQFVKRVMALYDTDEIVILREPWSEGEVRGSLRTLDPEDQPSFESKDIQGKYLVGETVIDLKICKIRLSQLTTPTSIVIDPNPSSTTKEDDASSVSTVVDCKSLSAFALVTPTEDVIISAMKADDSDSTPDTKMSAESRSLFDKTAHWENEISAAIMSSHGMLDETESELAFRHQMILGSLHSHVVSGKYTILEKVLSGKGTPEQPFPDIDKRDAAGLTPLHYACFGRSAKAVEILLNAGADVTARTVKGNKTPAHICCRNLDDKSLSLILQASKPSRADPNALDSRKETPMYVAIFRGESLTDKRDPNPCLEALQQWGGHLTPLNEDDQLVNGAPMFDLIKDMDSAGVKSALRFSDSHFPIMNEPGDGYGRSLNAIYLYPLHSTLACLRGRIMNISDNRTVIMEEEIDSMQEILKTFIEHGFEVNERVEYKRGNPDILNEILGFTPLQVLSAVALDLLHYSGKLENKANNSDLKLLVKAINDTAELLVSNGARVKMDLPTISRNGRKLDNEGVHPSQSSVFQRPIDPSDLSVDKNKSILVAFGGVDKMKKIKSKWEEEKSTPSQGQDLLTGKGHEVPDCNLPGGNDQHSCAICWKKFGKVKNKRHFCRGSRRLICDACCTKTVEVDGEKLKVSDGQFNLARSLTESEQEKIRMEEEKRREERNKRIKEAEARRARFADEIQTKAENEGAQKYKLFKGGKGGSIASSIGRSVRDLFMEEVEVESEDPQDRAQAAQARANGVVEGLNQTRNAFIERGEKLENMAEKSAALNNAAEDFANMAKQLADSQQKGVFGW